jgi:hypothetical protein
MKTWVCNTNKRHLKRFKISTSKLYKNKSYFYNIKSKSLFQEK